MGTGEEMAAMQKAITTMSEQNAGMMKLITELLTHRESTTAQGSAATPKDGGKQKKKILDRRDFANVGKLEGKSNWNEYSWQMKLAVNEGSEAAMKMMTLAESIEEINGEQWEMLYESDPDKKEFHQVAAEFYGILSTSLNDEGLILIQGVNDLNGFAAWRRLYREYNPTTPAKALQSLIEIITPIIAKSAAELKKNIESWELKTIRVEKNFGDCCRLGDKMKVAILTAMCPPDIQDIVYQSMETVSNYTGIKEKILTIVRNRMSQVGEPMRMDNVQQEFYREHGAQEFPEAEEVGSVGRNLSCHTCGGIGHYARECPSQPKGKGKSFGKGGGGFGGFGGQAKGFGKGGKDAGTKGGGKGGFKGSGKTSDRLCFNCNKPGHIAANCWSPQQRNPTYGIEEETEEALMGGAEAGEAQADLVTSVPRSPWLVAGVSEIPKLMHAPPGFVAKDNLKMPRVAKKSWKPANRFHALEEEERKATVCYVCNVEEVEAKRSVRKPTKKAPGWDVRIPNGRNVVNNIEKVNEVIKSESTCAMEFHMTDAKRFLASAEKVLQAGNEIRMSNKPDGSYVRNVTTGKRIPLVRRNGVFVMQVYFLVGEKRIRGNIVLDSGASECVMPGWIFSEIEALSPKKGVSFVGANGDDLGNYGRKVLQFEPVECFPRRP